jgi:hypothetical protein
MGFFLDLNSQCIGFSPDYGHIQWEHDLQMAEHADLTNKKGGLKLISFTGT